jgi:hypothetical protein
MAEDGLKLTLESKMCAGGHEKCSTCEVLINYKGRNRSIHAASAPHNDVQRHQCQRRFTGYRATHRFIYSGQQICTAGVWRG